MLISKTFDNGVICASEQSVVVVDSAYEAAKHEFIRRGAYFLTEEDKEKVGMRYWYEIERVRRIVRCCDPSLKCPLWRKELLHQRARACCLAQRCIAPEVRQVPTPSHW